MLRFVARLLAACAAALALGALTGLAARALMRAISGALGHTPEFSWPGTLGILLVFTVLLVPAAVTAAYARRAGAVAAVVRWSGTVVSAGLLLTAAAATAVADGADTLTELSTGRLVLAVGTLVVFALVILAGTVLTARAAGRWADRFARGTDSRADLAVAAG